jgi:hypothetical protein
LRRILATAIGVDASQLATRAEACEQQYAGATGHDDDDGAIDGEAIDDDGVAAAAVAPAAAPPRAGAAVEACLAARLAQLEAHAAHARAVALRVQRRCERLLGQHALLARHVAARQEAHEAPAHEALVLPPAKAARFAAASSQEGSQDSSGGGGARQEEDEEELRSGACTSQQQQQQRSG